VLVCAMAHADAVCDMLPVEHPLRSRLEDMKRNAHRAAGLGRLLLADTAPVACVDGESPAANLAISAPLGSSPHSSPRESGPTTLLVVENEAAILRSMVQFLSHAGYSVLAAESAEEALAQTQSSDACIDLVITDVTLPTMTGQQLAGTLAAFRPELKFLFVSGHAQSALLPRDVPGLNRSYLEKPFSLSTLAEKVSVLAPPRIRTAAAAAG
jgi:CheY-like chemotaxis protein